MANKINTKLPFVADSRACSCCVYCCRLLQLFWGDLLGLVFFFFILLYLVMAAQLKVFSFFFVMVVDFKLN